MRRVAPRLRILEDGGLEVVDPGFAELELLRAVDPGFAIRRASRLSPATPRFLRTRRTGVGLELASLPGLTDAELWATHARTRASRRRAAAGEASRLHVKVELARRQLSRCRLCAHACGVNRLAGERGTCGLGPAATVAEHFVHIGEEPPINPSLVVSLGGCGLRCRYCQQWEILDAGRLGGPPLDASLWQDLDTNGARSLSFAGGNPDESLPAILAFLAAAPEHWRLPVVWNCHLFASPLALDLLDGVVDVYLGDFKYGAEACGRRLSGARDYPDRALASVRAMLAHGASVIVRLLVLPGHVDCCHLPALQRLSEFATEGLWLSIRGQYCPDYLAARQGGVLGRRPTAAEVTKVTGFADQLGLCTLR
jgi:putative pyruvate formate lyase activating enzyme